MNILSIQAHLPTAQAPTWQQSLDILGRIAAITGDPEPLHTAKKLLAENAHSVGRKIDYLFVDGVNECIENGNNAAAPHILYLPLALLDDMLKSHLKLFVQACRAMLVGDFGALLRTWRKSSRMTMANLAAQSGVPGGQLRSYDNALPMHYPANARYGGDAGMSSLVATGTRLGIRCALHENYVDYYPNYDFYNTNDIALDSAGHLQHAWYNPGTRIQSFAVKPDAILRLAATQSPEIHRRYNTLADYLDVHSAVPPWFHVDDRAGEIGAGQLSRVWDVHRQLWAYERDTHNGPVFGEGNNHWYWSGCLDGVEAQFGSGWPGNGGFTAPLAVDFDLLKIHPLQFNHGMGYYSRWWPSESYQTNWAGPVPMVVLDRYRMQEVAYGHAGFLDSSVYANIPLAWLEEHLLSPVTARYAQARPQEILYENHGAWIDSTAAAKLDDAGVWNRVRVRYENGLVVTANGASNVLALGAWLLPDLGWVAEGAGITAGTTVRDGVIADFADSRRYTVSERPGGRRLEFVQLPSRASQHRLI